MAARHGMRAQKHIQSVPDHKRDGDEQPEQSERSRRVTPPFRAGGSGLRHERGRRRQRIGGMGAGGDHYVLSLVADEVSGSD